MIPRLAALAAAGLLVAACGGGDDAGRFDAHVDQIRTAVSQGDRQTALAALDELSVEAMRAHAEGDVDDAELQQLDGLLQDARAMVDEQLPAPTTTARPTTTTTQPPPPPPDEDDEDEDDDDDGEKGNSDRGRGNDKGKDD